MINPRSLPYARVYLSRLSPHELPHNALKQYHNYTAKRKNRDSTVSESTVANETGLTVQHPSVRCSFASGENDCQHTGVDAFVASGDANAKCLTDQSSFDQYSYRVGGMEKAAFSAMNVLEESCDTGVHAYHLPSNYSCTTEENDCVLSRKSSVTSVKDSSVTTVSVQSAARNDLCLTSCEVHTKPGEVQPCRRNSVSSTTSSHSTGSSKGKKLIVSLRPVTWDRPRRVAGQLVGLTSQNDVGCNDVMIFPGTKARRNLLETNLKLAEFSSEDSCTVTSTSSTADVSEPSTLANESVMSTGFSSLEDHVICGCEDKWPDFSSYSPPESPAQENENAVSEELDILPIQTDAATWETGTNQVDRKEEPGLSKSIKGEKSNNILDSLKCGVRCLPVEYSELLSPEVKLVPLDRNSYKKCERRLAYSKASPPKRKPLSSKGDIVIRLVDIGDKLKPRKNGGFTIVSGRYTTSGRKVLSNYSEKALAQSSMKGVVPTERKRRRKNKAAKGSESGRGHKSVADPDYKPGGKKKKRIPREKKKNDILSRYEKLEFKKLNTIPRMSVRYKVAFTKWPYVFSGALDLINQRISNQNTFWNSIRS